MHHGIFQYCPDLSVVELPESVESVGQTLSLPMFTLMFLLLVEI